MNARWQLIDPPAPTTVALGSTGGPDQWRLVDPPAPVAVASALGAAGASGASGGWRLVDPPPPVAVASVLGASGASGGWRLVDPPAPVAVASVLGESGASDGWRLVDPPAPVAVASVLADAPGVVRVRMLEDDGALPILLGPGPAASTLFGVVQVVARHQGTDHHTVEPDPDGEGLRIGIGRFSLASGALGRVLALTARRDPEVFRARFGADAEALLATANAATRELRLAPVGAGPLWSGDWPQRVRAATELPSMQAAQNEYAIDSMCRPLVPVVAALGARDGRALALAYDRAVAQGTAAAGEWVLETVAPLDRSAREQALVALGLRDWSDLRSRVPWLPASGGPDTLAHAAVVEGLWRSGRIPRPNTLALLIPAAGDPAWAAAVAVDTSLAAITLEGPSPS